MGFSNRDEHSAKRILRSQGGQGVIEYILVLIVTVSIILGAVYQLNSAFKEYLLSYFGDYLSCLLETGELPTIGGSPGDSGICNAQFKAFTIADGRPANTDSSASRSSEGGGGSGGGEREGGSGRRGGGSLGSRGGFSNGNGSGGRFGSGSRTRIGAGSENVYTGSTDAGNYGNNRSRSNNMRRDPVRTRLDNRFAFEEERENSSRRRSSVGPTRKPAEERGPVRTPIVKNLDRKKGGIDAGADSGMTFPNFIRYLIIAGILIALFLFLGGQMLTIGKSMD